MNVAVLGVDRTGHAIAQVCARRGCVVSLHDADATTAMDSIDVIERRLEDDGVADPDAILDRIDATTDLETAAAGVDIVVETTCGSVSPLQERFAAIEELVDTDTIIATALSTVSVTAAAAGLRQPGRALGLSFYKPLESRLVEIVVPEGTTSETVERAQEFTGIIDRDSVVIHDVPGVASTRLGLSLEAEAMRLVANRVTSVPEVDTVVQSTHETPMGPLERADRAGLDNRLDTFEALAESLGPRFDPPALLVELVETGRTGATAGEGFYNWEGDDPVESALPRPEIADSNDRPADPSLE
jgi:3-hydroxybutyryl-CoA dehydrogenase